jgi:hypothetical protein
MVNLLPTYMKARDKTIVQTIKLHNLDVMLIPESFIHHRHQTERKWIEINRVDGVVQRQVGEQRNRF